MTTLLSKMACFCHIYSVEIYSFLYQNDYTRIKKSQIFSQKYTRKNKKVKVLVQKKLFLCKKSIKKIIFHTKTSDFHSKTCLMAGILPLTEFGPSWHKYLYYIYLQKGVVFLYVNRFRSENDILTPIRENFFRKLREEILPKRNLVINPWPLCPKGYNTVAAGPVILLHRKFLTQ